MLNYYNKSSIGYDHINRNVVCQDFSACYHDSERTIITACDGHGGKPYVRSHLGSEFASESVIKVLKNLSRSLFDAYNSDDIQKKIKLAILCEWNALVEQSLTNNGFSEEELKNLSEDDVFKLMLNPQRAYGTTLNGAMVLCDKLICVNIGDGGIFIVKDGKPIEMFGEDDNEVANITNSMCEEDAFHNINVCILDTTEFDGVIACTDGLTTPYQNLSNFCNSFIIPITNKMYLSQYDEISEFIEKLASKLGTGDDVSFAMMLKAPQQEATEEII